MYLYLYAYQFTKQLIQSTSQSAQFNMSNTHAVL